MEKQTLGEIVSQKLLEMIQRMAIRQEISFPRKPSWWNFWGLPQHGAGSP